MFGPLVATLCSPNPRPLLRLLFGVRAHFCQSEISSCAQPRSSICNPVSGFRKNLVTGRTTSKSQDIPPEQLDQLLQDGSVFQGSLRFLHRHLACVTHPVDRKHVFIFGLHRTQALNGDIVLVRTCTLGYWKVPRPELEDKLKSVETEPLEPLPAVLDDPDPTVPDINTSSDDVFSTEFVEPPSSDSQPYEESVRPASKFHNLFLARTLHELASNPSKNGWPPNLPTDIDLSTVPHVDLISSCPSLIRTGTIVGILKKNPRSRRFLGQIGFFKPRAGRFARRYVPVGSDPLTDDALCLFVPNSANQPLVKLDPVTVPKDIFANRSLGFKTNYVCRVTGWSDEFDLPCGIIDSPLGNVNELEPATQRILLLHGLEDKEFSPEHLEGLPAHPDEFVIPRWEYLKRKDFRSCCIVSIDPASAKDIDDALHIKTVGPDLFEVGIHIADVSYFVKPGTPLDHEAAERSTSIYLVQRVIPMLPDILSQHLCSLQPCADRLAFSVVLTVRSSGEIKNTWFGRSIIRSRAKLSYEQALALLEHAHLPIQDPKMEELAKLLPIPESPFRLTHVRDSLVKLNEIAGNLRKQRIANGALTLQKCKIEFDLPSTTFDPNPTKFVDTDAILHNRGTVWPRGYSVQAPSVSHQLIEEWMLAANQAVAKCLFSAYKEHLTTTKSHWLGALLRRHSPPSKQHIKEIANLLSSGGITLQDGSSRSISATLYRHNEKLMESGCSDKERKAVMDALSHLIYLRMKMATYFSLDDLLHTKSLPAESVLSDPETIFQHTWHYGLCVPLYTHFTSPIRRYADLLVHRQLDAILSKSSSRTASFRSPSTQLPLLRLAWKAAWCNKQRMMSRRAQEANQQLFLTACIRDCGPLRMDATVLDLTNYRIKVFLSDFGVIIGCALRKFMIHTQKWDVIRIDRQDDPNASTSSSDGKRSAVAVVVECNSETTQHPTSSDRSVSRKEIRCLSVIPCRVYSRNDRLVMHAEYFPYDDPVESVDMEHHDFLST